MTTNFNAKDFVFKQKGENLTWTTGIYLKAIHNLTTKQVNIIDNAIRFWNQLSWATKAYQEYKDCFWSEACTYWAYRFAQEMIELEKAE